jgi:hypothetical protein
MAQKLIAFNLCYKIENEMVHSAKISARRGLGDFEINLSHIPSPTSPGYSK